MVKLMVKLIRWELQKYDAVKNQIIVFDTLSKKEKSYHVPNSTHAILNGDVLFVSTSDNKVMKVSLHNGSRKILSIEDYKNIYLSEAS